jgi:hypothetical protein
VLITLRRTLNHAKWVEFLFIASWVLLRLLWFPALECWFFHSTFHDLTAQVSSEPPAFRRRQFRGAHTPSVTAPSSFGASNERGGFFHDGRQTDQGGGGGRTSRATMIAR